MASGYFIGQLRYRTFPLSQKVLWPRPEAHSPRRAAHRKAGQTSQRCGVQRPQWQEASGKVMIRGGAGEFRLAPGSEGVSGGCPCCVHCA